ncbi:CoA transferase [Luedemannella helvata]|uniref:CaiB/BaiF CoA-transferase family protein n=1 Tax=Luedemannella helvata TaxID=349315 RepID=A0ABN2JVF6_9ACTN
MTTAAAGAFPTFGDALRILPGVTVLEIGTQASAPSCGAVLASLGADVIKVEHPRAGDPARAVGPFRGFPDLHNGLLFEGLNRAKRSVTLNLTMPSSVPLVAELARNADVVIENAAPGGYPWPWLETTWQSARPAGLVACHLSPLGAPAGERFGPQHELQASAASGMSATMGLPDRPPLPLPPLVSGINAGLYAATAVLAVLSDPNRRATVSIEVTEAEALLAVHTASDLIDWVVAQRAPIRTGAKQTRDGFSSETVACADGWAHVSLVVPAQREHLRALMAGAGFETDEELQDETGGVSELVRRWLVTQTRRQLLEAELAHDVGVVPLLSGSEFAAIVAERRGTAAELEDALLVPRVTATDECAPRLGQHNGEVWPAVFDRVYGDAGWATEAFVQGLL